MTAGLQSNGVYNRSIGGAKLLLFNNIFNNFIAVSLLAFLVFGRLSFGIHVRDLKEAKLISLGVCNDCL